MVEEEEAYDDYAEEVEEALPDNADLGWPKYEEDYAEFAVSSVEHLQDKGYCVVHMYMNDAAKHVAFQAAKPRSSGRARGGLKFARAKKEMEQLYVGRGSAEAKVAWMDGLVEDGASTRSVLDECDLMFSGFQKLAMPLTRYTLGWVCDSRTPSMVRLPLQKAEEGKYELAELSEEAIEEGILNEHVDFARRRTLCMFLLIYGSGTISLQQKAAGSIAQSVTLQSGQLLVFQHDQMTFSYTPEAEDNLAMQSWILKNPLEVPISMVSAGEHARDEFRGLRVGPRTPDGVRVQALGLASGFPGGGDTGHSSFWSSICTGTDGFIKVPLARYDMDLYTGSAENFIPGMQTYAYHGGHVMEDIYACDCSFFGWDEREAVILSPEIKKCTERGYEACFMAGETRKTLSGRRIGTYIGNSGSDWHYLFGFIQVEQQENSYLTRTLSGLSNRLAYEFNLKGPCSHFDTACSSSLVAYGVAHTALRSLEGGQAESCAQGIREAIVLGANFMPGPGNYIALSGPHMLSIQGRCFTFDSTADGFGRGEGSGAIFVRQEAHSEDSFATVMGACLNEDGRSATLTAPNGPAQSACIRGSMQEACTSAREITVAELHGTGTALGDPVEVGALRKVMEDRGENPIMQTSAKTHIGHLEAGAGIAGIQKAMLMCSRGTASPNCHLKELNSHLEVEGYPTIFGSEAVDILANSGYSGVSSFGFGGANARADVWAAADVGPHRVGEVDGSKADYVYTSCPIDGGPISILDGTAVPSMGSKHYVRGPYHATCIRDEFAEYDYSSYAYNGTYMIAPSTVADGVEDDHPFAAFPLAVRGSWTAFQVEQELQADENGTYYFKVELGETRYEQFHFVVDHNQDLLVYPALHSGSKFSRAMGPDNDRQGHNWMIDGRDSDVPAGTMYRVAFRWGEPIRVTWCFEQDFIHEPEAKPFAIEADSDDEAANSLVLEEAVTFKAEDFKHAYYIVGSWNGYAVTELKRVADETGLWETAVRIGNTGQERFHFVRDKSEDQRIYPVHSLVDSTKALACGPDDLGHSKDWLVTGKATDVVQIQLRVVDARITVRVLSPEGGVQLWESEEGLRRHTYAVSRSVSSGDHIPMEVDDRNGQYRWHGSTGEAGRIDFTILVDGDASLSLYPEVAEAMPGESIVQGPNKNQNGNKFVISSLLPECRFELVLNLKSKDRRKIVDVRWLTKTVDHDSLVSAFQDFYVT